MGPRVGARLATVAWSLLVGWLAAQSVTAQDVVCPDCEVRDILCERPLVGQFPRTQCRRPGLPQRMDLYRLSLEEELPYLRIDLTADFDTWMLLFDAECQVLDQDDDGGLGVNSRIEQFDVAAGEYWVGVSSFGDGAVGPFGLEVQCDLEAPPPPPGPVGADCERACVVGTVSCGDSVVEQFPRGTCNSARGQRVDLFEVFAGSGPITVNMTAGFDTYLHLYNEECRQIGQDDDGGDGLNSMLVAEVESGRYFIGASSFGAGARGAFTLEVRCSGGDSFCIQCRVDTLQPEAMVTGTFPSSACTLPDGLAVDTHRFRLSEPFRGTLTLASEGFPGTVALFDQRCDEIDYSEDCDAEPGLACLDVDLEPGIYAVVVSSIRPGDAGAYSLSATLAPEPGEALFYRGDVGDDGNVALDDAVLVFNFLFQGGAVPACLETADANNSGGVDLTDGVVVLNWLFGGGPPPEAPGPPLDGAACGPDTDGAGSPGDLGCSSYTSCN